MDKTHKKLLKRKIWRKTARKMTKKQDHVAFKETLFGTKNTAVDQGEEEVFETVLA
jgi:hypothetical protein